MTAFNKPNRLILESSPYLLQHASNPIDWFPWCEEAFAKAKEEGKPVFLSIGYSACHWCHVMEKESFEDQEVADILNKFYICIKVDREERPEIDAIYMNALQAMTGSGGWPMSLFLTPEAKPFFGGTYFPPEERYGMPSFKKVLSSAGFFFLTKEEEVTEQTNKLLEILNKQDINSGAKEVFGNELLNQTVSSLECLIDRDNGGFGAQPKFPQPMSLDYLMKQYLNSKNSESLELIDLTLKKMAEGGIYDQLGGGFHRYSVDEVWLVPHFEKMLCDNAQLLRTYLAGWKTTGNEKYRKVAEETLDYVLREMTSSEGGFYSTQDADSDGKEGTFFIWSEDEMLELLDGKEKRALTTYYGVTSSGNFERKNILSIQKTIEEVSEEIGLDVEKTVKIIESGRDKLFSAREKRIKPFRDEKIITEWNGLMIHALADCAALLDRKDAQVAAEKTASFILEKMRQEDGKLYRTYKDGRAKLNACLEDYSSFIVGLIALYETTFERKWLESADELAKIMFEQFADNEVGGFFQTGNDHENLLVRRKDIVDNALPSGNSLTAESLLKLSIYFDNTDYRNEVEKLLSLTAHEVKNYPGGFGRMLTVFDLWLKPEREIVVVGDPKAEETQLFLKTIRTTCLKQPIVLLTSPEEEAWLPLMKGKVMVDNKTTAYVCEQGTCKAPVTNVEDLKQLLQ